MTYDAPRFCQIDPAAQIGDDVGYGFLLLLRNFATRDDAITVAAEEGGKIAPAGPLNYPRRLWAVIVPGPALFDSGDEAQQEARADCVRRALRWPLMVANDRHRDDEADDAGGFTLDKPKAADDANQWDFETTFPEPTPAALRELVADIHYPTPGDEEAIYWHFQEAAKEYGALLDAADAHAAAASHLRETGRYAHRMRPPTDPTKEAEECDRNASGLRDSADALIEQVAHIYGDAAAEAFRCYAERQRQTTDEAGDDAAPFTLQRDAAPCYAAPPGPAQLELF